MYPFFFTLTVLFLHCSFRFFFIIFFFFSSSENIFIDNVKGGGKEPYNFCVFDVYLLGENSLLCFFFLLLFFPLVYVTF